MKKAVFAISVFVYFVATCGVVINYHYCMKKLASVHLFDKFDDECSRCGMITHESNGCCHDEIKVVKLVQDQNKLPDFSYELLQADIPVSTPSAFIVALFENEHTPACFRAHSPPLLSLQDTYIQISVFRI